MVAPVTPWLRARVEDIYALTNRFITLMQRFEKCGEAYGVDFTELREAGMLLLSHNEVHFVSESGRQGSVALDDMWSEWAYNLFTQLQDSQLNLDFTYEKEQLREFLRALTVSRSRLIKS